MMNQDPRMTRQQELLGTLDETLMRIKNTTHNPWVSRIFVLLLFVFIIGFLLTCIWISTNVYQQLYNQSQFSDVNRKANFIIANTVKSNDAIDFASVESGPNGDVLVLTEFLANDMTANTYIYLYDGKIVSQYLIGTDPIMYENGEEIVASNVFDVTLNENVLEITTDYGTDYIALYTSQRGGE